MSARRVASSAVLLAVLAFPAPALRADEVPSWLREAAAVAVPRFEKKVPAVVLASEAASTIAEDGRMETVRRYAVRVLDREGRGYAVAQVSYATDLTKVRDLRAWLLRPSGDVKRYGKGDAIDRALALNDVYDESRLRLISAESDTDVGAVFGYEAVTEERMPFAQLGWGFQESVPVLLSRFRVTLPAGWRVESKTFNHAPLAPVVSAGTYTWELRDLPRLEDEPASPPASSLAAMLAVNYFPVGTEVRQFADWKDVSRWYSALADPQAAPDEALAARAKELTREAKTELDRVRAVARYAQDINYISIQVGNGRHRPHPAAQVFAKSYGDCKDKATLMRAMLKSLGITAHLVLIDAGDPAFVREEWPSPSQFNHAILAVSLKEPAKLPAVLDHPRLGRVLFFDPTDPYTPVGELPEPEQGSLALLAAGEDGGLVRVPLFPPEASGIRRQTEAAIAANGTLSATMREEYAGWAASRDRSLYRSQSAPEYRKTIEDWVARGATGARLSKIEPADDAGGPFRLNVDFAAPEYAQLMQGRLLVFRPFVVGRARPLRFAAVARVNPVLLRADAFRETVRVTLPDGFVVDELPAPVSVETPFGSYKTTVEARAGEVVLERSLSVTRSTLPAAEYAAVRSFFARVYDAEQAPIVLAKK